MMVSMGRPREYTFNLPEDWKVRVVAEIERRKLMRQDIAKAVGITPSMLSRILKPLSQRGARASSKAPLIAEYVGVPLPGAPTDAELDEANEYLTEIRMTSPAAFRESLAALRRLRDSTRRVIRQARSPQK